MKNPTDGILEMSFGQKALWYLNQLEPDSTAYHLGLCLKLTGPVDEVALAAAWQDIGAAHPQLRARFILHDGQPCAQINPFFAPLKVASGGAGDLDRFWREIAVHPFNLETESPLRALLLYDANGPSYLLVCLHHIASDLWSCATLLRELSQCYAAHVAGRIPVRLCEGMEYNEFVAAEQSWLEGAQGNAAWDFWRTYLDGTGLEPALECRIANGKSGEAPVVLEAAEADIIRRAARERGVTPYAVLLACYARLLGEWSGTGELIIGAPASVRDGVMLRNTVGYLVNTVPVRCPIRTNGEDHISAVAGSTHSALKRRRFPFPVIVERLRLPRKSVATSLFQSTFAYYALSRGDRSFLPFALGTGGTRWEFGGGITAETVQRPTFDAQFPVALTLGYDEGTFAGCIQYDGKHVTAKDAAHLVAQFPALIGEILVRGKPKPAAFLPNRCERRLESVFDGTARRTPDAIATSERGTDLTYAQVKKLAEIFATGLDAALSGDARPVAVQLESSAEAAIILLAILKSGRAFLPIDPGEPPVRRNAALVQTGACALLSSSNRNSGSLPDGVMALTPEKLKDLRSEPIRVPVPSPTAYFIFTSGSTGEPKAVEVGHAAVLNHARAAAQLFGLTADDRVLQFHTLAFDAAFEEIFPTWAAGARIVFEPKCRRFSIPALLEALASNGITVLNLPTSHWHMLTSEAERLGLRPISKMRVLVVGGEQASEKTYATWQRLAPRCRWINTYGPTETTITALAYEPPTATAIRGRIPIGRPIIGVVAVLLNDSGEMISAGEGELLIGGAGLARGYRGDPEATNARFVMRTINGEPQRLFRTGDRVRLRRDGNFEYLGRLDRQLKVRGFRVDPDEIERALREHPDIAEVAVFPTVIKGDPSLTAYLVRSDASATASGLREHLSARLPACMIPSRLVFVTRLPRKSSGKIDAHALMRVRRPRAGYSQRGPQEIAALFSELLGSEVGAGDDFFLAGGHSLMAIRLLGRLEARYGARISLSDFLAAPSPRSLWKRIQMIPRTNVPARQETIPIETPVSEQQNRALLAHEIGRSSLANIVMLLRIDGQIDGTALQRAMKAAARQNPILRCGFFRTDGGVVIRETRSYPSLEYRTLPECDFADAAVQLASQERMKPFALNSQLPWINFLLVSTPERRRNYFVLITHHAVADGWALELLLDDLRAYYDEGAADRRRVKINRRDFRGYALAQAEWLKSPTAVTQASFWKQRLSGAVEPVLPFRRAAYAQPSWRVERRKVTLSTQLSRDLRRVAMSCRATPFAFAMACFKALIHRYAGQKDITLGTVVSNRSSEADQDVLGPLQNPALIRDQVTSNLSIRKLAQKVARSLAEAQDNGALPFEQVIRAAFPHRSDKALEHGIQFLSHDRAAQKLKLGLARLQPVDVPAEESPFELSVGVSTLASHFEMVFEYQPVVYSADGIKHLAQQYLALLQSAVAIPDASIRELSMTSLAKARALERRVAGVHLPRVERLHDGFEMQAVRNPDAIAVAAHNWRLTYGELNLMSESVADALTAGGLKAGRCVAVMLPKGWEQIVACLAVLKAGGVYVPLDPTLPDSRLKAVFEQGGFHSAIVLDETSKSAQWAHGLRSVLTIHSRAKVLSPSRSMRAKADSLAYVIFTSGTTGVPKGVMVSHQAAMTTIAEINRRFRLRADDRVLAVSALGFDLSVFDIFGTLRAGGTIIMLASQDPKVWLEQAVKEGATVWNSVPCLFELLLDEAAQRNIHLQTFRLVMLSGDFIPLALARRARTVLPASRLVSLGGATEAAIWSIAREIKEVDPAWRSVPYGRALRGQEMFVLNAAFEHCDAGVTGELFIAGNGLANGYWRDAVETKRRFVLHPKWKIRMYRTGDAGRYLENGEIEILGRLDEQVKINGVRLELGEVEAALCSLPAVRQAVAEIRADAAGNKKLLAFVAAERGTSNATLSAHAKATLPATLRPSSYEVLEQFPLTRNGKIDRAAIRAMALSSTTSSSAQTENDMERWIAELWSGLLGGVIVGAEDDFFALGGHSLLAIRMLQRVRLHFAVELPLSSVVERPTVRSLAAAVNAAIITPPKDGLSRRRTAEFESDSEPIISKPISRPSQAPSAVLLTGATGHLGSAMLVELLKTTNDRIYCLVRASSPPEAAARVMKTLQSYKIRMIPADRIVAVPADLSRNQFGLEPSAFAALAVGVRAVYHCAAEVNFIAPYEKLAASNVGGTREMIRLATAAGAVLHHVSSVAVFPYGGGQVRREDEDIAAVEMLTGGYAQSKWVSERMIRKAIAHGLRAVIYRPAQIVSRGTGGQPRDLFEHIVHACKLLQTVPDIDVKIDMVTPKFAASAIRALSVQTKSIGRAFHLVHPEPFGLRDFVGLLPAPPPLIPFETWRTLLEKEAERGDDPSLQFLSMLARGLRPADVTPPDFDCSGTIAGLRGTGIVCPPLDLQFIQSVLAPLKPNGRMSG